jgi:hypothetical protein
MFRGIMTSSARITTYGSDQVFSSECDIVGAPGNDTVGVMRTGEMRVGFSSIVVAFDRYVSSFNGEPRLKGDDGGVLVLGKDRKKVPKITLIMQRKQERKRKGTQNQSAGCT